MEKHRALLLGLFLFLVAVDWSLAESQPDVSGKTGDDPRDGTKKADVVSNPTKVDKHNKGGGDGGNNNKIKEEITDNGSDKNGLGSQSGPKESDDGAKGEGKGDKSGQLGDGSGDNEKKKDSSNEAGSKTKIAPKDEGNEGDTKDQLSPPKDEVTSVDGECDPPAKCTSKNKKLVACLRQTGHESPEFSLLVQNKGKKALDITISGPDFVRLQNKTFQLQGEHEQQVKVELEATDGEDNNLIVLKAENEICDLNLTLITLISEKKIDRLPKLSFVNFMSRTPVIALISFAALLILASAWTCFSFRKKLLSKNGSKYQRVEMELPVSGAGKTEPEVNDGWDNNWGDEWDDEEAPLTPSIPVIPNPSSKGLASRRSNKDGWKD